MPHLTRHVVADASTQTKKDEKATFDESIDELVQQEDYRNDSLSKEAADAILSPPAREPLWLKRAHRSQGQQNKGTARSDSIDFAIKNDSHNRILTLTSAADGERSRIFVFH